VAVLGTGCRSSMGLQVLLPHSADGRRLHWRQETRYVLQTLVVVLVVVYLGGGAAAVEVVACINIKKLESSHRPQTFANAMLFARWQHHIRFGSGFPYAPLKAMLTKISK